MIRRARNLLADTGGSSAIEFVIAVPVLVSFVWGMFQIGMLFEANAGIQNALGEAARYATIYVPANDGPPTDTQILNKLTTLKFGTGSGTFYTACPETCITNDAAAKTKLIEVTYVHPTNFLFFQGPDVTLTASKLVYYSPSSV
jgi:Flp pilus assembly protein TadG